MVNDNANNELDLNNLSHDEDDDEDDEDDINSDDGEIYGEETVKGPNTQVYYIYFFNFLLHSHI